MHRINTSTAAQDMHGQGKNGFRDGNPQQGVRPTQFNAAWANTLQEEASNLIEKAGLVLDEEDNTQLYQAVVGLNGMASGLVIDAIALLGTIDDKFVSKVFALGYWAANDGSGGEWYLDRTDTASVANGIDIVTSKSGYRWKRKLNGQLNLRDCGFKFSDADHADKLQKCINRLSALGGGEIVCPEGNYFGEKTVYIQTYVKVRFAGSKKCKWTCSGDFTAFQSNAGTDIVLTQTAPLLAGQSVNAIANTLAVGDCVVYKTNRRFTRGWDGGTVIRDYYLDGEVFEIVGASSTSLSLSDPALLDFPLGFANQVIAWKPGRNAGLFGVELISGNQNSAGARGLYIYRAVDFAYDDIKTKWFETGIKDVASIRTNGGVSEHIGTVLPGGTNYGVQVSDGSKHFKSRHVIATGCRHATAGGGSGFAIPMYARFDKVTATDTKAENSIDAHGGTAYFTYGECIADKSFSLSGMGHEIKSMIAGGGRVMWAYEGGQNLKVGRYTHRGATSNCYQNKNLYGLSVEVVDVELGESDGYVSLGLFTNCWNVNAVKVRIVNQKAMDAATAEAVTAAMTNYAAGVFCTGDLNVQTMQVQGFRVGFHVLGKFSCADVELSNCGYTVASTVGYCFQIDLRNGIFGVDVSNIRIKDTKAGLSGLARYGIMCVTSGTAGRATPKQIVIRNVTVDAALAGKFNYAGVGIRVDAPTDSIKSNLLDFIRCGHTGLYGDWANFELGAVKRDCDF